MNITSLESVRPATREGFVGVRVDPDSIFIDAWMPSEVNAISPFVDQLMQLIEGSPCVVGNESAVELALREALNNAVIHGNCMDAHKQVQVRCRCERGAGISLTVKDQGIGFDPTAVADPLTPE
jgi:anti-sigma regulatory factor (Ser/Thr protein kinase)